LRLHRKIRTSLNPFIPWPHTHARSPYQAFELRKPCAHVLVHDMVLARLLNSISCTSTCQFTVSMCLISLSSELPSVKWKIKGSCSRKMSHQLLKKREPRLMRRSVHLTCLGRLAECFFMPPRNLISIRTNLTVTDHKRSCVASQMSLPCGKATHEKAKTIEKLRARLILELNPF